MGSSRNREHAELVRRCLDGDESAWSELVQVIRPAVLATCRAMRLSRDDCVDVFGQVSYLILTNLHRLRSPEKILSYAVTTARREILAIIRRSKTFERTKDSAQTSGSDTMSRQPDELLVQSKRLETLLTALSRLSKRESALIWKLFLSEDQPTYEEISAQLGIPVSSIGPTRARALDKLRQILKRMDYDF